MADEQKAPDGISRRRFLSVVGVSSAGAVALSGCSTDKVEKLIPYLVQSEDQVPGIPTIYASTCTECSAGCGLHVVTREARAVKLEGNPEHPVNKGKLCARGQAALQGLYNPGRTRNPRRPPAQVQVRTSARAVVRRQRAGVHLDAGDLLKNARMGAATPAFHHVIAACDRLSECLSVRQRA